jgi:hypothetical protein
MPTLRGLREGYVQQDSRSRTTWNVKKVSALVAGDEA